MNSSRIVAVLKFVFFVAVIAALSCGCATIVSKSHYAVNVQSSVEGAKCVIRENGRELATVTTPTMIDLSASSGYFNPAEYMLEFSKDGYESVNMNISASVDMWYIGNIVFGGLIGFLIVDPATGAMWKFDTTRPVYANMERKRTPVDLQIEKLKKRGLLTAEESKALIE